MSNIKNSKKNNNNKNNSLNTSSSNNFTPCGCQCTSHDLFTNCHSCGYLYCLEDKRKYLISINYKEENEEKEFEKNRIDYFCPFCNTKLKGLIDFKQIEGQESSNSSTYSASSLPTPSLDNLKEAEYKVLSHRDKLIQFDREFAKRTVIRDLQSDYYNSENNVWLTEDEKKTIKKIMNKKMSSKYKQPKLTSKIDIHLNVLGNKVFKSNTKEKDENNIDESEESDEDSDVEEVYASQHHVNKVRNLVQNKSIEKVQVQKCSPFHDQRDQDADEEEEDYYQELLFKSKSAFERIQDIDSYVNKK